MLKPLTIAIFGAVAFVLFTNPASIPNPIGWAWNGVVVGRNFTGRAREVFDGRMIGSINLGWWFLFKSLNSSMPLVARFGMISGAVVPHSAPNSREFMKDISDHVQRCCCGSGDGFQQQQPERTYFVNEQKFTKPTDSDSFLFIKTED